MMYFVLKVTISALLIAAVSEIAKRSSLMAALVASLPLTSILALCWIYGEQKDEAKIMALSRDIFWLVIPSLAFFLVLPMLMKAGLGFPLALTLSCFTTAAFYGFGIVLYRYFT